MKKFIIYLVLLIVGQTIIILSFDAWQAVGIDILFIAGLIGSDIK